MAIQDIRDKAEYVIVLTNEFGKAHGLSDVQAFSYLCRFHGIDFIIDHYDIAHTLSFREMVEAVGDVCMKSGGQIAPHDINDMVWLNKI